jgi:hypothetical protein
MRKKLFFLCILFYLIFAKLIECAFYSSTNITSKTLIILGTVGVFVTVQAQNSHIVALQSSTGSSMGSSIFIPTDTYQNIEMRNYTTNFNHLSYIRTAPFNSYNSSTT